MIRPLDSCNFSQIVGVFRLGGNDFLTVCGHGGATHGDAVFGKEMMKIERLANREAVWIDDRRLEDIVNELGCAAAQNVVGLAMEQIALAMTELRDLAVSGALEAAAVRADRLSRLAWQVGLVSLAGVAVDVAIAADRGDHPAFAATVARMMRVGNQSVTEIWDAGGLRG